MITVSTFDLTAFVKDVLQLPEEALLQAIQETGMVREIEKGECVIQQGDVPSHIIFLIDGIFRGFFSNQEGKEITDCFVTKAGMTVMPSSDIQKAAPLSLEAVVDSHVLYIPIHEVTSRMWRYRSIQKLYYYLLIDSYNVHWDLKTAIRQYDAQKRYQWFCEAYPGLVGQVKDKDIASFLGITPVTLSRVRRSLREEEPV